MRKFSSYAKAIALATIFFIILFLFTELVGNYEHPTNFVKSEERARVNNYIFGKNIFFDEFVIRYPENVSIVETAPGKAPLGISTDTDKLNFGILPLNFSERKRINIRNPMRRSVEVKMYSFGNINRLIKYPKKIIVKPGEERYVTIKLNATELGNFSGEFDVVVRYPTSKFSEVVMKWI